MSESIRMIPLANLALAFIPVAVVIGLLVRWSEDWRGAAYAVLRMVVQLLLIGYLLVWIFRADTFWIVVGVVAVMIVASSWIALQPVRSRRRALLGPSLIAIAAGGTVTLLLMTEIVLDLAPWYRPDYFVPLAGMVYANAMNTVSLAAERLQAEVAAGVAAADARRRAFRASLIPVTNSLLAVGLVSLPGMMTGQILSGVDPLVAVRYQILVMCMVYGSAGLSAACFLALVARSNAGRPADEARDG
ncbi:ABC transporter permease [Lentisalinibacter sediminis]|uniref:ABC transporter permease n=1 Tax=Lentisalinibacter sediminis TaxID=2992237 RepID=UPI003870C76D